MNILELKRKLLPMSGPQMSMGGGGSSGGGGGTQIQELPEWARPYAKDTLEKGAALTEKPYQTYGGDRFAGFSPMQQQAQQGAANMQTNQGTGAGLGVAGAAALGGLNQDYNGMMARSQNFGGRSAAQYMNPYVEQAMQPQLREAERSSAIQGQQNQAKAVGQGAFGGSRSGLVEAERQRNLAMQQGDIRSQGLNTAYNNAQNQFNADQNRGLQAQQMNIGQQQFGANLGLQGLNTALQGANTLGQLGGQQFQQGMDINKLQNAYGGQQQALQQQGLSQAYEDFQNQNNYGYKQLGFMSDLIRGLPLGQQTATQMYAPNPSAAQNVAALGAGAYGLSKFMAEGGMAYADGGSVDSPDNVAAIVHTLSDQDLQKAMQAAQARGDMDQLEAIQNELAMRASLKNGIAGGVTDDMVQRMAGGGGVLAFQSRGEVDSDADSEESDYRTDPTGNYDPSLRNLFLKRDKALSEFQASPSMTRKERAALEQESFDRRQKFAGEDPYAPMTEKFKRFEEDRAKNYEEGKGLAAIQAIPEFLEGGNAARGIGRGVGKFGGNLAQLAKSDAAEKRALAGMDFNLKDAQRKERMGLSKEAMADAIDEQKNRIANDKLRLDALKAGVKSVSDAGRAFRTTGSGAGGAGKGPKIAEQLAAAEVAHETNPTDATLKQVTALRRAVDRTRTTDVGTQKASLAREAILSGENAKVQAAMNKFMYNPKFLEADAKGTADAVWKEELDKQRGLFSAPGGDVNKNSGNNTPPPPPGFKRKP
jgi:hypothetical protein